MWRRPCAVPVSGTRKSGLVLYTCRTSKTHLFERRKADRVWTFKGKWAYSTALFNASRWCQAAAQQMGQGPLSIFNNRLSIAQANLAMRYFQWNQASFRQSENKFSIVLNSHWFSAHTDFRLAPTLGEANGTAPDAKSYQCCRIQDFFPYKTRSRTYLIDKSRIITREFVYKIYTIWKRNMCKK